MQLLMIQPRGGLFGLGAGTTAPLQISASLSQFSQQPTVQRQTPGVLPLTAQVEQAPGPFGLTMAKIVPIVVGVGGFAVGMMFAAAIRKRRETRSKADAASND